jgi:hypothetical protein
VRTRPEKNWHPRACLLADPTLILIHQKIGVSLQIKPERYSKADLRKQLHVDSFGEVISASADLIRTGPTFNNLLKAQTHLSARKCKLNGVMKLLGPKVLGCADSLDSAC